MNLGDLDLFVYLQMLGKRNINLDDLRFLPCNFYQPPVDLLQFQSQSLAPHNRLYQQEF